jgi:hypothetical protein
MEITAEMHPTAIICQNDPKMAANTIAISDNPVAQYPVFSIRLVFMLFFLSSYQ